MGYRSDVRCVIYGRPDQMDAFIAKHKLKGNQAFEYWKDSISIYSGEVTQYEPNGERKTVIWRFIDLCIDGVKWYDEFEEVGAVNALLDDIDDTTPSDPPLFYEFVRVGEDTKDIDVKYSNGAYGYLSTTTNITTDLPDPIEESENEEDRESQSEIAA